MANELRQPKPIDTLGYRLCFVAFAIILAFASTQFSVMQQFERVLYDARAASLSQGYQPDSRIALILIDEESLDRLEPAVGSWPWPRQLHATILDFCSDARVVAMDILFAEQAYADDDPADDRRRRGDVEFSRIVSKHGNFVAAVVLDDYKSATNLPPAVQERSLSSSLQERWPEISTSAALVTPFQELTQSARRFGHVNNEPDIDGSTRQYPLVVQAHDALIPSLALCMVQEFQQVEDFDIAANKTDFGLRVGQTHIPLDARGWYRFSQVNGLHTAYRYSDVLDAWKASMDGTTHPITPHAFKDKIVIIGSIAEGLVKDITVTAGRPRSPGMQVHADVVDSILNHRDIRLAHPWLGGLLIFLLGLAPGFRRFERSLALIVTALIIGGTFYIFVYGMLYTQRIMIPMATPLLALLLSSIGLGSLFWYHEQRKRRWLELLEIAKQKFTDMLVHDLKNSIVPLNMAVQMSRTPSISQSFILNELPMYADRATSQLLLQVNSILDIRKMQEGKMPVEPTLLDPVVVIEDILENYRLTALHGGLSLDLKNEIDEPLSMLLDPDLFKRVSENLIWNAIKYSTNGAQISVTCSRENEQFRMNIGNHSAVLPESEIEKIFGAYVSGKGSRNTLHEIPSSGLGLAFCKLAIEAHDGTIVLKSPWPGHDDGVCVTVAVPIKTIHNGQT